MPLIIIIVSLVGLLMKVKKLRSSASIMRNNAELREAQQSMEGKINNRIGMVCGTFIVLQLPAYLVSIIVVYFVKKSDSVHFYFTAMMKIVAITQKESRLSWNCSTHAVCFFSFFLKMG